MKKTLLTRSGLITLSVFFVLLTVSGVALKASGYWENPFAAFGLGGGGGFERGREGFERGGEGFAPAEGGNRGERAEGFTPPAGFSEPETSTTPVIREEGRGGRDSGSINWSQFGGVLYDIWMLFAVSGVVIVFGLVYRFVRGRIRRSNQPFKRVFNADE